MELALNEWQLLCLVMSSPEDPNHVRAQGLASEWWFRATSDEFRRGKRVHQGDMHRKFRHRARIGL